jgi:hypothetical protein
LEKVILRDTFWQSPSTLLVAKSVIRPKGNWAGFWGNNAAPYRRVGTGRASPDLSKIKVVGLSRDMAES